MLRVENLTLQVAGRQCYPVWDLTLRVAAQERVAVVGESGSGKTSLAWAVMGRPLPGQVVLGGRVLFRDRDILNLGASERRDVLFREISLAPQNAMYTLHPTQTVARSLAEIYNGSRQASDVVTVARLLGERLGLPGDFYRKYPHQLSGGQRQRVALLLALINRPQLAILDEPTTALDALSQHRVETLLDELNRNEGTAFILLTHDINLACRLATRIVVLYRGQVVEELPSLSGALHPYTRRLAAAALKIGDPPLSRRGIPGYALPLGAPPAACGFADRCPEATPACRNGVPPLVNRSGSTVRCFLYAAGA